MRGFRLILIVALTVSFLFAAVAFLGGSYLPDHQKVSLSKRAKAVSHSGKASQLVEAVKPDPKPVVQMMPAPFMPAPETSLAQSSVVSAVPESPAQVPPAPVKSEAPAAPAIIAAPPPAPAVVAPAPTARPDQMIHVATATAPLPTPSAAHIPALVAKLTPAKVLFGAVKEPANMATRSIGFYARGCLAGAKPLPVNGPAWQAMRLSRNRMWGHPSLVKFIERFAKDAKAKDGWPGLLVGDMSMPRGGPMPSGHASHQVGLDVDIWYKPMPDRELSPEERENIPMESFLSDPAHVNPKMWSPDYVKLLRRAVSYPEVARIFVNPAIKKWLCDNVQPGERAFLHKIQPIPGHDDHFHVRLVCPADNPGCRDQPALPVGEGCGKGLDTWIAALSKPKPAVPAVPVGTAALKNGTPFKAKGRQGITLAQLPPECEAVLKAPSISASR